MLVKMKQVIYFYVFAVLKIEMVRVDTTGENLEKTWRRPGEDLEILEKTWS